MRANVPANVPNDVQSAINVCFVPKQLACAYRAVSKKSSATLITCEQLCLTSRVSEVERKETLAHLCLRQNMASIFALKENEQRKFVKVPRSARSRFCDLQNVHNVECCVIEQYFVKENVELCTVFCSDKLCAEDTFDNSADEAHLPVSAVSRCDYLLKLYSLLKLY